MSPRRYVLPAAGLLSAIALTAAWVGASSATTDTEATGSGARAGDSDTVRQLSVEVQERYPHDIDAFTQGFELHDGVLYESTGRYGQSDLRTVEVETGKVIDSKALPDDVFAEGLTLVGDSVWQLTWQEGFAYLRDAESLAETDRANYDGEGWGLCHDAGGDRLVMSDGSAELTFRDPDTFAEQDAVTVTRDGEPVTELNELECVDGEVWANVWQTDEILRIDPESGDVLAVVDASGLLDEDEASSADVLNGIAYDEDSDTFLITGKLWPATFRVTFE